MDFIVIAAYLSVGFAVASFVVAKLDVLPGPADEGQLLVIGFAATGIIGLIAILFWPVALLIIVTAAILIKLANQGRHDG